MGNLLQKTPPEYSGGTLKFDRILDAEHQVYIGIGNSADQVIRIGDYTHPYHNLVRFAEDTDELHYEFEHDITMTLQRKNTDEIHMKLVHNHQVIIKQVDPIIVKYFKHIDFSNVSDELDKIHGLFHKSCSQFPHLHP